MVEPLALEVCLFDNNRCAPSSSFSSGLLGCGTMVLTPIIIAGILAGDDGASDSWIGQETAYQPFARRVSPLGEAGFRVRERKVSIRVGGEPAFTMSDVQQEAHSSSRSREVVLFEPGSGNRIASIILGVALSLHRNSRNGGLSPPLESLRVAGSESNLSEQVLKVRLGPLVGILVDGNGALCWTCACADKKYNRLEDSELLGCLVARPPR